MHQLPRPAGAFPTDGVVTGFPVGCPPGFVVGVVTGFTMGCPPGFVFGVVTGFVTGAGGFTGFMTGVVVVGTGDTPPGLAPGTVTIPGAVLPAGAVTGLVIGAEGKFVVGGLMESNSVNL